MLLFGASSTLIRGIGIWGNDIPVAWGFAITNFVWWIGIGHAGTFISAILLLLEQRWRTSINRFAEAMTLFAVAHGRDVSRSCTWVGPWFFYWLVALSGEMDLLAATSQRAALGRLRGRDLPRLSLLFWYVGLIPDLATLRDRAAAA